MDKLEDYATNEFFIKLAQKIGGQKQWAIYVDYVVARPLGDKEAEYVPAVFEMVDSVYLQKT